MTDSLYALAGMLREIHPNATVDSYGNGLVGITIKRDDGYLLVTDYAGIGPWQVGFYSDDPDAEAPELFQEAIPTINLPQCIRKMIDKARASRAAGDSRDSRVLRGLRSAYRARKAMRRADEWLEQRIISLENGDPDDQIETLASNLESIARRMAVHFD